METGLIFLNRPCIVLRGLNPFFESFFWSFTFGPGAFLLLDLDLAFPVRPEERDLVCDLGLIIN